ncbi:MAG TPA: histidinol dehydrogenase [Candidatus Aveggerthella excrementigallinarum]|nr:histidinol dehydrogenase [Candidatus Aveggerthella excrementigallinarum]
MKYVELEEGERLREEQLTRQGILPTKVMTSAAEIVARVREEGDAVLRELSAKFDGVEVECFRVPQEELDTALDRVDARFVTAIEQAAAQIRDFHEREVQQSWFTTRSDGTLLGVKVTPMESAGIYVPGGRAQYPSTVLMNVIPAKVAGVERVVMVTPPQKEGGLSPYTLAAAKLGGVDEVYTVGGAQAIAALAYGTESIPKVSVVTGPGNAYVAAAKRLVSGDVAIDMVAGPSEVCVLADATADPMIVAADLMAQAEHDPLATSYLVTCDAAFAREVERFADELMAQSPREEITRASFDNLGVIVVARDMAQAVDAVNVIAPEHLELHCKDAMGLLGGIKNAGAIFVGAWSSEPLGDYVAGPNHTLPTGGTAVYSSPLSVDAFVKKSSVVSYTPQGLLHDADAAQTMAQAEGLWAHALSVGLRRQLAERGADVFGEDRPAAAAAGGIAWPITLDAPKPAPGDQEA